MADTIPNFTVPPDQWVRLDQFVGINSTESVEFYNKCHTNILLYFGTIEPSADSKDGFVLKGASKKGSNIFLKGSDLSRTWIKVLSKKNFGLIGLRNFTRQLGFFKRYITSLSSAGGMYYQLSEPVVIGAGDFEVEANVVTLSTDTQSIMGCSTDLKFKIVLVSGTVWVLVGDGTTWQRQINSGVNVADGASHAVGFRKASSDYQVIVDGVIVASSTDADPVSVEIDRIALSNSSHFTGEIYDVKIWTGGDRNTGTLVLDMPIDEDWTKGTVVHNKAADLGVELTPSTATVSINSAYASVVIPNSGSLTSGKSYLYSLRVVSAPEGSACRIRSMGSSSPYVAEGGRLYAISTADFSSITLQGSVIGDYVVDELSVREIPAGYPFATAINVTENEAEKFTLVDGGANWLGENEYVTLSQTWKWSGEESNYSFKTLRTDQTVYLFRETLDLTNGVTGQLKIQSSASGGSAFKNAGDVYIRDISHGTSNTLLQTSAGSSRYVGESKASLKRLIPIAQTDPVVN